MFFHLQKSIEYKQILIMNVHGLVHAKANLSHGFTGVIIKIIKNVFIDKTFLLNRALIAKIFKTCSRKKKAQVVTIKNRTTLEMDCCNQLKFPGAQIL